MERLIGFFVRNRLIGKMLLLFIFAGGFYSLSTIQREGLPTVSLNTITITTIYPGAAPEDVELNVTVPIERELQGVSGIEEMTSTSSENISVITIQADQDLGPDGMRRVLDDVKSAIDQVQNLPAELDGRPQVKELRTTDFPVLEVALTGPKDVLRGIACRMEAGIRQLPGVGVVTRVGCFDREVHVELNPWLMERNYISFDEVVNSILTRNVRTSGGSFNSYIDQKSIVTLAKFRSPLDVRNVILRSNFERQRVLLSQVANVRMREKDERLMVRSNGRQGVSLVINKKLSADVIRVVDAAKQYVRGQKFPDGVKFTFINDLSNRTRKRIDILTDNGIMGFVLVLVLLLVFLNLRTALWTAFGIPFSILGAFLLMPAAGQIINIITLGGFLIVIGMLVDDAIVVAEHIESYKEQGMEPEEAAIRGAKEMVKPVSAAAFTTMAAYMPMFFLGGASGKFVWGLPVIVILTLSVSLFESFFLLPGHIAHGKKKTRPKPRWLLAFEDAYRRLLRRVLRRKYLMSGGLILLLFFTLFTVTRNLKVNMFPSEGTEQFYIKVIAPVGSSMERTVRDVSRLEKYLLGIKNTRTEILSFSTRVGHLATGGASRTSGDHENWAIITIYLSPISDRKRTARQIIDAIRKDVPPLAGSRFVFEERRIGPPLGKPAEIVIMGNVPAERDSVAAKIQAYLRTIPGVTDVDRDDKEGKKQLVIEPDYGKLAAFGLTTRDVADLIRAAFDGRLVTSLQTLQQEIFYRVILGPRFRKGVAALQYLKVRNKAGNLIPLDRLVRIRTASARQTLYHYNGIQAVTITAELDTKKTSSLAVERLLRKNVLDRMKIPASVQVMLSGEAKATRQIFGGVALAFLLAIAAIFFIVAMVVKSSLQSMFVLAVIPFSLIGVIWTWYIHGMDISFFSILGFLGLAGVVVNDSIVMVDRLNSALAEEEDKKGKKTDLLEIISSKAATRLRPIVLTTVTTMIGLFPSAYGIGGDDPLVNPLALTMSYGLLFATLITLFLVPSMYLIRVDWSNRRHRKKIA